MLTAALDTSIVPNPLDVTQQEFVVYGTITPSGNYTANGDTLDLSNLQIPSNGVPNRVEVYEAPAAGTVPTGDVFVFCPGTTQKNGVVVILTASATQFNGAYGNTFSGIKFRAWFTIGQ